MGSTVVVTAAVTAVVDTEAGAGDPAVVAAPKPETLRLVPREPVVKPYLIVSNILIPFLPCIRIFLPSAPRSHFDPIHRTCCVFAFLLLVDPPVSGRVPPSLLCSASVIALDCFAANEWGSCYVL